MEGDGLGTPPPQSSANSSIFETHTLFQQEKKGSEGSPCWHEALTSHGTGVQRAISTTHGPLAADKCPTFQGCGRFIPDPMRLLLFHPGLFTLIASSSDLNATF